MRPRLFDEIGQEVQHFHLVVEVEEGRGLVEKQDVGLLRQGHGDPDTLALAAGELVDGAVGEVERAGGGEGLADGAVVGGGPAAEPALVGIAAAADEIGDEDGFGGRGRLRQDAETGGDLERGHLVDGLAIEIDGAARGRQQAREAAQQRGLAAGIGAHDHGQAPLEHVEIEFGDDAALAIAEIETGSHQSGLADMGFLRGIR